MSRSKTASRLAELIPRVVHDLGVSDRLDETRVEMAWRDIAGPQIDRVTRRVRLKGDRLVVQLKSAAWRQALTMQRDDWLARLQAEIGTDTVREIVFR